MEWTCPFGSGLASADPVDPRVVRELASGTKERRNFARTMKQLILVLFVAITFASCKKDDDPIVPVQPPANEEEVITTLVLTFTDIDSFEDHVFRFTDLDGDGGNAPVIEVEDLPGNRDFAVFISLLNESVSPTQNITTQIEDELEQHQFFFQTVGVNLTMSYGDEDANLQPVGLINNSMTLSPSTGTLKVTLRHNPDKSASGVSSGDITNAGGDTDIEVTFPVVII